MRKNLIFLNVVLLIGLLTALSYACYSLKTFSSDAVKIFDVGLASLCMLLFVVEGVMFGIRYWENDRGKALRCFDFAAMVLVFGGTMVTTMFMAIYAD